MAQDEAFHIISDETAERLKNEGWKTDYIRIIDESTELLTDRQPDKEKVLLGAGQNTRKWRHAGFKTVDVSYDIQEAPGEHADFIIDAAHLDRAYAAGSLDCIATEYLPLDVEGKKGVKPSDLLEQSYKALKSGGKLVILSASMEGNWDEVGLSLPHRDKFARLMAERGFKTVVVVSEYDYPSEDAREQSVVYYGEKPK